eukprot:403346125
MQRAQVSNISKEKQIQLLKNNNTIVQKLQKDQPNQKQNQHKMNSLGPYEDVSRRQADINLDLSTMDIYNNNNNSAADTSTFNNNYRDSTPNYERSYRANMQSEVNLMEDHINQSQFTDNNYSHNQTPHKFIGNQNTKIVTKSSIDTKSLRNLLVDQIILECEKQKSNFGYDFQRIEQLLNDTTCDDLIIVTALLVVDDNYQALKQILQNNQKVSSVSFLSSVQELGETIGYDSLHLSTRHQIVNLIQQAVKILLLTQPFQNEEIPHHLELLIRHKNQLMFEEAPHQTSEILLSGRRQFSSRKYDAGAINIEELSARKKIKKELSQKIIKLSDLIEILITSLSKSYEDKFQKKEYLLEEIQDQIRDLVQNLQQYFDASKIIRKFKKSNMNSLIMKLIQDPQIQLSNKNKQSLIIESFIYYIDSDQFDKCMKLLADYPDYFTENHQAQIIDHLALNFKDPQFMEYKVHIIGELLDFAKYRQIEIILQHLEKNIESENTLFYYNQNPIKLAMIIIDFLEEVKEKFRITSFRANQIKDRIEEITKNIIKAIPNSDELKQLLQQRDFRGNDSLHYMALYNVYTILDTSSTDRILQDFWRSNIDASGYLMEASTSFRILSQRSRKKIVDVETQNRFYKFINIKSLKSHQYQFNVWKKSMQVRYFIEAAVYVGLCIFFQVYISEFNNYVHKIREELNLIDETNDLQKSVYIETLEEELHEAGRDISIAMYMSVLICAFRAIMAQGYNAFETNQIVWTTNQDYVKEYESLYETLVMFIQGALGNWDLNIYDNLLIGKQFGQIYHLAFLIFNMILLVNLIIAILSTTFAILHEKQLALYYDGIIEAIPQYKYDRTYGSLVCSFPPFNILVLPFTLVFAFYKNEFFLQKLNNGLLHISYFPVFLTMLVIFIALNLILIPLAYLYAIGVKIQRVIEIENHRLQNLTNLFVFLVFGLLMLVISQFFDIVNFIRQSYSQQYDKLQNSIKPKVSNKAIKILHKICLEEINKNKRNFIGNKGFIQKTFNYYTSKLKISNQKQRQLKKNQQQNQVGRFNMTIKLKRCNLYHDLKSNLQNR